MLNSERSEVKQRQREWQELIKSQQVEVEKTSEEARRVLKQHQAEYDRVVTEQEGKIRKLEEEGRSLELHLQVQIV